MQRFIFSVALGLASLTLLPQRSQAAETGQPAYVAVTVPADAKVWFDEFPTTQTGTTRYFYSPPLEPSSKKYVYHIRAEWTVEGQAIKKIERVAVRPGERMMVEFSANGESRISPMDEAASRNFSYTPGSATPSTAAPAAPVNMAPVRPGSGKIYPAPESDPWAPLMPYGHVPGRPPE